ncbi:response regulator [Paucihalobacter sp.]|uniref:response regulator n=1 Tax=Paucihalobacter sp. TaxID=2850405 RepID=UPI003D160DDE
MAERNLVMIIDDNDFDRYVSKGLLKSSNFSKEILEFDSAKLAYNYLEVNQDNLEKIPEVIFLDIYMPLMNGFEFINLFESLSPNVLNNCKICVLSTTVKDEHFFKAKSFEKNIMFTNKPITLAFLNTI